jgi:hypothetical protein
MCLVDAAHRDGYSVCNVDTTALDIAQAKSADHTNDQLAARRVKQSLLDLLKKEYKYRFD